MRTQDNFTCEANQACRGVVNITNSGAMWINLWHSESGKVHGRPIVHEGDNITVTANVSMCSGNWANNTCLCNDTYNGTQWTKTVTQSFSVCNSTQIVNRTSYQYFIKVVPKPRNKTAHVVPLISTCRRMGIAYQETLVRFKVTFPPIPECKGGRTKRDWIDKILGGSGTLIGLSNTIDNQILSSKLGQTGKYTAHALDKQAKWMPHVTNEMKHTMKLWKAQCNFDIRMWNESSDVLNNATA